MLLLPRRSVTSFCRPWNASLGKVVNRLPASDNSVISVEPNNIVDDHLVSWLSSISSVVRLSIWLNIPLGRLPVVSRLSERKSAVSDERRAEKVSTCSRVMQLFRRSTTLSDVRFANTVDGSSWSELLARTSSCSSAASTSWNAA